MEKKFELTEETIVLYGHTLYRIKALKKFGNVKKGDLRGFIEKEDNLSQDGDCWIYDNAKVYDNALVSDNARVFDDAIVHGNAKVYHDAWVYQEAQVYDNAQVYGNANVYGEARVFGNARLLGTPTISGDAKVFENARVYDNAYIYGYTRICGDAEICGDADICGNAVIKSDKDYIDRKSNWRNARYFTWTKSNNMWRDNTFYGTGDELVNQAYEDDEESGRKYEIIVDAVNKINSI